MILSKMNPRSGAFSHSHLTEPQSFTGYWRIRLYQWDSFQIMHWLSATNCPYCSARILRSQTRKTSFKFGLIFHRPIAQQLLASLLTSLQQLNSQGSRLSKSVGRSFQWPQKHVTIVIANKILNVNHKLYLAKEWRGFPLVFSFTAGRKEPCFQTCVYKITALKIARTILSSWNFRD